VDAAGIRIESSNSTTVNAGSEYNLNTSGDINIDSGDDIWYNVDDEVGFTLGDDFEVDADGDLWMYAEESIEISSDAFATGYHGLFIDVEDDNDVMEFLPESVSYDDVELYSDDAISVNVNGDAGLELNADINAALIYGDSVLIDGRFVARDAADFYSSVNVDGATTLNSTLDVDGQADFHDDVNIDIDLDVDGVTTLDSLNVHEDADFDMDLHVDGSADIDTDFDVDGVTTLDSLNVHEDADFDQNVHIDGNFNVDGISTVDSLNAAEGVYFESTLEVDGTSQFNDDVNVDATLTADSATTEYHLMVQTPDMVLATVGSAIFGMPEFEVQNMNDVPVFQVDGHTEMTTVKDMTVTNSLTVASSAGLNVAGSFTAGQAITSSQAVYAGPSGTSGVNGEYQDAYWPGDTDYNQLVRKDYVDYHRVSETDVPQAYSYDASLITASIDPTSDYNDAVYYMNGNVVLYEDSVDTADKNYLFTVRGVNFDMIRDGNTTGLVANDEVIGYLWAENNSYELNITRVSDTELTFELGYDDINGIVACTDGVVRPTLSIGGLNNQQNMTGLTFFLDIVASTFIP
jgi:hypothetical protein